MSHFNPRTREGCDEDDDVLDDDVLFISIHAPVKGATRFVFRVLVEPAYISIHAPVKGATLFQGLLPRPVRLISIHAPVKGATSWTPKSWSRTRSFQSTHP